MAEKTQQGNPDVVANRQAVQNLQKGIVPVRIDSSSEPVVPVGMLIVWRNGGTTKLLYNDRDNGQIDVTLT